MSDPEAADRPRPAALVRGYIASAVITDCSRICRRERERGEGPGVANFATMNNSVANGGL